jgi:uncharacterized protein (DUF983 family)
LFRQFLKVVDHCSVCGKELHHHRADDFPPYIVILVVGHTLVPAALAFEMDYAPPMWLDFLIWIPLTIISALALLQPTKGMVVAMQWQLGMHGFGPSKLRRLDPIRPFEAIHGVSTLRWVGTNGHKPV